MSNPYAAACGDHESIRRIAEAHGVCLVKGVLSPAEMEALALDVATTHEQFSGSKPDILSCPLLSWLAVDPRILSIARALMPGELVYYGESNIAYERKLGDLKPYDDLHVDALGLPTTLRSYWEGSPGQIFRGYRFAVYLQDYSQASGGLKVAIGSHVAPLDRLGLTATLKVKPKTLHIAGKEYVYGDPPFLLHNVPSQPGDLVVWSLRTMHSAGARRLVSHPDLALHPQFERQLFKQDPSLFAEPPGPRNAIFFDYGAPEEELDLYIKCRSLGYDPSREGQTQRWAFDSPAVRRQVAGLGIRMRHDAIIMTCCAKLTDIRKAIARPALLPPELTLEGARVIEKKLSARLWPLLNEHSEFSPYFTLFSREKFAELAAGSKTDAEAYAVQAVIDSGTRAFGRFPAGESAAAHP